LEHKIHQGRFWGTTDGRRTCGFLVEVLQNVVKEVYGRSISLWRAESLL
jgi:hypothetical protein